MVLRWNRADTETFSKIVSQIGVSAVAGANPLLLTLTVVALAKAFHKAHQTGEYANFVDGHLKGGIGTGAALLTVSQVGAAGGPVGLTLLVGLCASILAHKATKDVSLVQIAAFVAERAKAAATEIKKLADPYVGTS